MAGISVDPLSLRMPAAWQSDREISAYILQLQRVIISIRERTGGGDDKIDELYNVNGYETGSLAGRTGLFHEDIDNAVLRSMVNTQAGQIAALQEQLNQIIGIIRPGPIHIPEDGPEISTRGR